jgi:prevent-host-death family protein
MASKRVDSAQGLVYVASMTQVNVREVKTQLSRLLAQVAAGEEVLIAKAGKPVARLVPVESSRRRMLGQDKGLFEVPDDFDDPLPTSALTNPASTNSA